MIRYNSCRLRFVYEYLCDKSLWGSLLLADFSVCKKALADLFYRQPWRKLSKRKVRINNLRGANVDVRLGKKK